MSKHVCCNKEFNKKYLEQYVIMLLEKHLFNKAAMERTVKNVHQALDQQRLQIEQELFELMTRMDTVSKSIETVSAALNQLGGSETLMTKMATLEAEKADLENDAREKGVQMAKCQCDIDGDELLLHYMEAKFSGNQYEYRSVIMEYVEAVTVYHDRVMIRLRTGLGLVNDLNMFFDLKRSDIYGFFGSRVRSA